jgi:oxygen-independent coproporphyrinogen-3 oxidase
MEHAEVGNAVDNTWEIAQADLGFEFMMNALRLTEGFQVDLFQERTGLPLITLQNAIKQAVNKGLLSQDLQTIKPTLKGQRYLNDLLAIFLD